ncbi:hypothetical protein D8B26_000705 [Coccidioides posadasii str. Silveira]|uniref:uncharacterized protein n=1 Tax=Coccidioides posadasii (strain RMSCC 757 / Silveira) TaxID=443226 RepID=UPI001BEECF72|nr:hypothetical protein D8B26_000705 [Coccidioides posadasii str. Silveira]
MHVQAISSIFSTCHFSLFSRFVGSSGTVDRAPSVPMTCSRFTRKISPTDVQAPWSTLVFGRRETPVAVAGMSWPPPCPAPLRWRTTRTNPSAPSFLSAHLCATGSAP